MQETTERQRRYRKRISQEAEERIRQQLEAEVEEVLNYRPPTTAEMTLYRPELRVTRLS